MKRFLMVLALGAAMIGCGDDDGDDDDDTPGDAGDAGVRNDGSVVTPPDSGVRNDGGMDAAVGVTCGGMTCTGYTSTAGLTFTPVCVKNAAGTADVCGLSTAPLGGVDAGYPPALEKNAPGVASVSCGAFYDALEAPDSGTKDGRINSTVMALGMTLPISYAGCCTAKGFCSGDTNTAKVTVGGSVMDTNAMFGCMESTAFFRAAPPQIRAISCNATTGMIQLPAPDAGVPDAGRVSDAGGMDSGL